jgi:type I restriction-modification system DNA methylase subunit
MRCILVTARVSRKATGGRNSTGPGTAGFLVASDHYIKAHTDDLYKLSEPQAFFQRHNAFIGAELVPDTHRLCMMNLLLHGIEGGVELADTLSPDGERLSKADLVLTNPPFGTKKGGGRPTRSDFSITADTSNKQLAFVEHIVRTLTPGGRAAIVVPDNVLFEENAGRHLRTWLMDLCNLHTILRLPTGIFYAPGVKTNVLFFQRGKEAARARTLIDQLDQAVLAKAFREELALQAKMDKSANALLQPIRTEPKVLPKKVRREAGK